MSKPINHLTAQEFAKNAGVSPATVSKWLREGTIAGKKVSGKWSIPSSELAKIIQSDDIKNNQPVPQAPQLKSLASQTDPSVKSYSIKEFSDLTYLTEFGVQKWLKEGRLTKAVSADGQIRVDGASLQNPHVKRLLR